MLAQKGETEDGAQGRAQRGDGRDGAELAATDGLNRDPEGDRHQAGQPERRQQFGHRRRMQQQVRQVNEEGDNGAEQVELPGPQVGQRDLAQI